MEGAMNCFVPCGEAQGNARPEDILLKAGYLLTNRAYGRNFVQETGTEKAKAILNGLPAKALTEYLKEHYDLRMEILFPLEFQREFRPELLEVDIDLAMAIAESAKAYDVAAVLSQVL